MFALSYGSWNQLNLAECSSFLNAVTQGVAEWKVGFIPWTSTAGFACSWPCPAGPRWEPLPARTPQRSAAAAAEARPQPPLEPRCSGSCYRSFGVPHSALCSSVHCHFSFRGGCLVESMELGAPRRQGLPRCGRPERPQLRRLSERPAPISPQRYLKGLVDISRVGWAVWVGFPVLEVSWSRPSAVPPSRPGPALPAPEGPASSRLPPLGLDLHSDV